MYKAGYLEQAEQYYEAKIAADPKQNADSHYMLGNILLQLKRPLAAKKEYRLSADLNPFGSTGKYSRQALEQLRMGFVHRRIRPSTDYENDNQQKMKNSVRAISLQINEEESKVKAEHDTLVKQITSTAAESIQQIEDEMHDRIALNGRRNAYINNTLNATVVEECRARIEFIRSRMSCDLAKAQTAYQDKIQALEDSAQSLEKSYISKQSSDVLLNPIGSDIYLRNYQVDETASGNPVPVMAAPPKALPTVQPNKKDSHQGYVMWVSCR
jgi:tetratricopeptide (TPR) repeat protein